MTCFKGDHFLLYEYKSFSPTSRASPPLIPLKTGQAPEDRKANDPVACTGQAYNIIL